MKRVISEISEKVDLKFFNKLVEELNELGERAQDAIDLNLILQNAIRHLYRMQPLGDINYAEENYRLAKIYVGGNYALLRDDGEMRKSGENRISCQLSKQFMDTERRKERYFSTGEICTINLREKTYYFNYYDIPETLKIDTDNVMKCLGLEKKVEEKVKEKKSIVMPILTS